MLPVRVGNSICGVSHRMGSISFHRGKKTGIPGMPNSFKLGPVPPRCDNSIMPQKFKLPVVPRVPNLYENASMKPPRRTKETHKRMGEETVHNKLILGQYGLVAVSGGDLKHQHFELMRNRVNKFLEEGRSFAIYRVDPPYKPITTHGLGRKLGGGKGSIRYFVTPIKAGRVILEVGGKVLWEEVRPWLQKLLPMMPMDCVPVSQDLMDRMDAEEKRLEETNENPYTFEWLVRNNMFNCQNHISPRDTKWFGRYTYRDKVFNKKWNLVRQKKYKGFAK